MITVIKVNKRSRGFTLIEIIIAIVVLVVGLLAVTRVFSQGLLAGIEAERTLRAINLVREKMEEVKGKAYANIEDEAKAYLDTPFDKFQREVVVNEVEANYKQVNVNVYWAAHGGEDSVGQVTLISNY